MGRTGLAAIGLAGCALALGCWPGDPGWVDPDEPDIVGVVPRTAVPNIDGAFDVSLYTTAGGFLGEILAVCGYNFNRIGPSNRVVIDGVDCRVLNYHEIDSGNRFGALFFEVSNTVPVGNARRLNVLNAGNGSSTRPLFDVHRLAYASQSSGGTVTATDISVNAPAGISTANFSVPSNPDTLALSHDARWAFSTSGQSLFVTLLADGQVKLNLATYFSAVVGPLSVSPNGRTLVAGVIATSPPATPDVACVDLSPLNQATLQVNPGDGSIGFAASAPTLAAPAITNLGGAFPGTFAWSPDSTRLFATLSSSVVREWAVTNGTTLTFTRDFTISGASPFGIAVTPDGKQALVANLNLSSVTPLDLVNNTVGSSLAAGNTPLLPVISTNGARAVVVNVGGTDFSLYDITSTGFTTHSPATVNLGASPGEIALSPDGPLGSGVDNQVLAINGNVLNYLNIVFSSGSVTLASYTTGPYSATLKKVAVTPKR